MEKQILLFQRLIDLSRQSQLVVSITVDDNGRVTFLTSGIPFSTEEWVIPPGQSIHIIYQLIQAVAQTPIKEEIYRIEKMKKEESNGS